MVTFGIFNDEGCIEDGFNTFEAADARALQLRINWDNDDAAGTALSDGDPNAQAREMCPDHAEQPVDNCSDCYDDEDNECEGHYDDDFTLTSGVGIGEVTYCDGSCRR